MNIKYIIAGVVILIVISGVFLLNSGSNVNEEESTVMTIQANDGSSSLDIPEGSLPNGVSLDNITIVRVTNGAGIPESSTAYDLEPDGTVFNEDVFLNVEFKSNLNGNVPRAFYLLENGEVEPVKNYSVTINTETGNTKMRVALSHFSRVILTAKITAGGLTNTEFFSVKASVPDTLVGQVVQGNLTVIRSDEPVVDWTGEDGGQIGEQIVDGTVKLSGTLQGSTNLSPTSKITNKPPSTAFQLNTYTVPLKDYTCTIAGEASITSEINLSFTQRSRYRDNENSAWDTDFEDNPESAGRGVQLTISMPFECINPPKEETSSSGIDDSSSAADSITTPQVITTSAPEVQFMVVNTVNGVPYAQAQFESIDPHDGCQFFHQHSNVTVYPFQGWLVRGGSDELQTSGNISLQDPEPAKCGFGRNVALSPKSVFVPINHFVNACVFFQFDRIKPVSDYDIKGLAHLDELCDKLLF